MDFRLATPNDDDSIKQLLSEIPLEGMLRIRYSREPSFFNSVHIQGTPNLTVVGTLNQKVMAVASLNAQKVYLDGKLKTAGYISNLRFHPDVRNGISLIKGIRFFEKQAAHLNLDFHYATLIEGNDKLKNILAGNRPRMPFVMDYGRINTFAIPLPKRKKRIKPVKNLQIIKSNEQMMSAVMEFIKAEGDSQDLFPFINENSYDPTPYKPEDFYLVYQNNQMVAVCSAIDLHVYKQYTIEGYSQFFTVLKPLLNLWLNLRNRHRIPSKSGAIKRLNLGFILVKNNNPQLFNSLLNHICSEYSGGNYHFVTMAFHETNPLNKSFVNRSKIKYTSRLFLVNLKFDKFDLKGFRIGKNIPFIDLSRL